MQNYIPSIKRKKRYNKTLIYYANKYLKYKKIERFKKSFIS